jgi:hypothetical protein
MTENIDNLLSRFYSPDQAEQIKRDIAQGEKLFDEYCAPQLEEKIINNIKLKISHRRKHTAFLSILVKTIAVAAVVVIASYLLQDGARQKPVDSTQNSYQAIMTQADNNITALEKEAELLRSELADIRLGEDNGTNEQLTDSVGNVETEIIDTQNFFWKG